MWTKTSFVGRRAGLGSVVLITGCLLVAGCSSGSNKVVSTGAGATAPAGASGATVLARSTKLGSVLTDASGMTLYTTTSACTGACASAWPPLTATGTPTAGPGVTGTLATSSGGQVTWNGHPLYRWMNDHAPGDTTGDGVNGFHAAIASGTTPVTSSGTTPITSSGTTPTTSGSGSGYGS